MSLLLDRFEFDVQKLCVTRCCKITKFIILDQCTDVPIHDLVECRIIEISDMPNSQDGHRPFDQIGTPWQHPNLQT